METIGVQLSLNHLAIKNIAGYARVDWAGALKQA